MLALVGIEGGGRSAGGRRFVNSQRTRASATSDDGEDDQHRTVGSRWHPPTEESFGHPEDDGLDRVGHIELRYVDPPLLWQLDEDPDERGGPDDEPFAHPRGFQRTRTAS